MTGLAFTLTVAMVPAPAPIVNAVEELVVELSIETASTFSLRLGLAATPIGDWAPIDVDPFRPLVPIGVRLTAGVGPPQAVINGYVTAHRAGVADAGRSWVEVRGTDVTGLMNLEEKVTAWPNMPDSVIASAIFGQYAVVPVVAPTAPRLVQPEGTTTQRGTDIRFLRRLARRNGFECYVQPEAVSGVDTGYFKPAITTGVPQAVLSVAMGPSTNVRDLQVRYDMTRPTAAVAAGIDTTTKAPQAGVAPVSTQPPMGLEPTLLRLLAGGRLASVRPSDSGAFTVGELQPMVQGIADRSSLAVTMEGKCGADVGVLRPGNLVALRGAGRLYSGLYLLTSVRIVIGRDRFEQHFTARRNAVTMTGAEFATAAASGGST